MGTGDHPPQSEPFLHNLIMESRAFEAIVEGIRSMLDVMPDAAFFLRQRHRNRRVGIKVFLKSDAANIVSLNEMVKRFGVNVNFLKRDFR